MVLAHKIPHITTTANDHTIVQHRPHNRSSRVAKICRTPELSLASRRAPGRHTDQTEAKANVLTCKKTLQIGQLWRPDSLSRSRKAASCE